MACAAVIPPSANDGAVKRRYRSRLLTIGSRKRETRRKKYRKGPVGKAGFKRDIGGNRAYLPMAGREGHIQPGGRILAIRAGRNSTRAHIPAGKRISES